MEQKELYELQRDILQNNLTKNPYLQANKILSLDKELKTESKKIIPAINEILKSINTFSAGIQNFMQDIRSRFSSLEKTIKDLEEMLNNKPEKEKVKELLKKYEECRETIEGIKTDIIMIKTICCNTTKGIFEMKFKESMYLKKGEGATSILKATELIKPDLQIVTYKYDGLSKSYSRVKNDENVAIYLNENLEVRVFNSSQYYNLKIYIFEM